MNNLFKKLKDHFRIICIALIGFIFRFITALSDKFLHPWDERFHALVSRNLMHSPFKPMLKANPITDNFDINVWCCNHIWLHKQPLFMWQMALSMKIFGVNELAMRLPSVLMGTAMILILFRITFILTKNNWISFAAASFLALSTYHVRMCAGIWGMDHNDVAHGFYVLASIWAYAEYTRTGKWYWVLMTGFFSGAAILVKWLTGLLVFLIWGLHFLLNFSKGELKRKILDFVIALVICILVFLPWQLYIMYMWPEQATFEYEFNRRHITEALEGHEGSIFYYLNFLFTEYWIFIVTIPLGLYTAYINQFSNKKLHIAFVSTIVFVFLFFSVIVKTKVDTHLFFILPICFIYMAYAMHYLTFKMKNKYVKFILPLVFIIICLNLDYWINYYSHDNLERENRIYNAEIYRNIKKYIPEDVKVVMNVNSFEDTDIMFYNNDITAYHWTLPESDFLEFEKRKLKIAVFQPHGNYNIPDYVARYPYLYIIKKDLKNF